jgi:hypothetical protein
MARATPLQLGSRIARDIGRAGITDSRGPLAVRASSHSPHHGTGERLEVFVLARFLHANRIPLRSKTL